MPNLYVCTPSEVTSNEEEKLFETDLMCWRFYATEGRRKKLKVI